MVLISKRSAMTGSSSVPEKWFTDIAVEKKNCEYNYGALIKRTGMRKNWKMGHNVIGVYMILIRC